MANGQDAPNTVLDDLFTIGKSPAFARQSARVRMTGNHGLENAGRVCHGEAEITGDVS